MARLGLDGDTTSAERELLRNLDEAANKGAVRFLALDGPARSWMLRTEPVSVDRSQGDTDLAIIKDSEEDGGAVAGATVIGAEGHVARGAFDAHTNELVAFARLDSDVIVTADRELLAKRAQRDYVPFNLMTPGEATVLIGVWTRAIHEALHPRIGCNNGFYYWATARAMTPSAWPGYCAFVYGERVLPNGRELQSLAGSILDYLSMLTRDLDRMIATWQCPIANDTMDELIQDFSHVVLDAWTVHDNIALLSGRYLENDLSPSNGPEWDLLNRKWQRAMRERSRS